MARQEIELLPIFERRRERYRQKAEELEFLKRNERSNIWTNGDGQGSDLISGLPDELVENLIWPRIQEYVEEVKVDDRRVPAVKERIQSIQSLSQTSRKWRHLVLHSKPWGGVRLIMEFWSPHYWEHHVDIVVNDFHSIMFYLPPLDIFCKDTMDSLTRWHRAWTHLYQVSERNFYLDLYIDPLDVSGRLQRWMDWRNNCVLAPLNDGLYQ